MTTATAFPAWLRDRLIEAGVLTAQGLSRRAKPMLHRDCGRIALAGFDGDLCAFDAWCDPAPLTPDGELHALLAGRRTYDLEGGRLYARDAGSIPGRPPTGRTVLAEHRCRDPLPRHWLAPTPPPATAAETEF